MADLEDKLQKAYVANGINSQRQQDLNAVLNLILCKDKETYYHSLRVGLLASQIGDFLHLDSKALLYNGLLHDVGKIMVDTESLTKKDDFNDKDYDEIKKHAEYSYNILKGVFNFSADVSVRHHRYQTNGYPENLPEYTKSYSSATRSTIDFYAMIVSLADFYDAAATRINNRHGEKRLLTEKEVKELMLKRHPHFRKLIDDLYRNGIFESEEVILTKEQENIEKLVHNELGNTNLYSPEKVRRNIQLALALEPLSEKPGCTTRSRNCSRHLKLEYFIAGAINVGDAFAELAEKLQNYTKEEAVKQPLIYEYALKAQLDSKKNRAGGRINEGMIEMLVPIVAAQIIYNKSGMKSVQEILVDTNAIIRNASRDDVEKLVALKQVSNDMCAYKREVTNHGAKSVIEFYQKELAGSDRPVSIMHNTEILNGFPVANQIYEMLMSQKDSDLSERVRDAYLTIRENEHKELAAAGLTADICGVALYLLFSQNPNEIIIR